jgi:hypothetical protein
MTTTQRALLAALVAAFDEPHPDAGTRRRSFSRRLTMIENALEQLTAETARTAALVTDLQASIDAKQEAVAAAIAALEAKVAALPNVDAELAQALADLKAANDGLADATADVQDTPVPVVE